MTAAELCVWLEQSLRGLGREELIQHEIDHLLRARALEYRYEREVRLDSRSRIDFMLWPTGGLPPGVTSPPGIGIEVKVAGSLAAVTRQLHRYAQFESVSELVLVTTKLQLARVPRELNGKAVRVAALLGGLT